MVLPDLPVILNNIDGSQHEWFIIPAFALTALLLRPISGKLCDTIGRVPVMCIGGIVATIASSLYLIMPFIFLFFVIRAFHGLSAGFTPTGFTSFADDVVPLHKRGEAMGIIGIFNNIGNAMGWVFGSFITKEFDVTTTFTLSSVFGFISLVIFINLKDVIKNKQTFNLHLLKVNKGDIFETRVWLPGIVMVFAVFSSGCILALIGDYSEYLNIENKGSYMVIYIAFSLFVRFFAGRWSDKYGRKKISTIGVFLLFLSMLILAYSTEFYLYAVSAILFGFAFGLLSPSLFAWAVDLAEEGKKGKAVGTLFIFLEVGVILGSGISGLIYNNNSNQFFNAFILSAILSLAVFIFLIFHKNKYTFYTK